MSETMTKNARKKAKRLLEEAKTRLANLTVTAHDLRPTHDPHKGKAKLSRVGQTYTIEAPIIFDPLSASVDSSEGDDRHTRSRYYRYTKNGIVQGVYEVPRRVSGDGIVVIHQAYRDFETGKLVTDSFSEVSGVIEQFPESPIGYTYKVAFVCPKCGDTHRIHKCKPDGLDHTIPDTPQVPTQKPFEEKPYEPSAMTSKPKTRNLHITPERQKEIDNLPTE